MAAPVVTKAEETKVGDLRVPPKIFEIRRGVSTIVHVVCAENGLGLYVEIAKENEAALWGMQKFSPTSTFRDVMEYLQSRGLSCAMRGTTLVIRNRKLEGQLSPLDVPFSRRAFKATKKEVADGVMADCAGAGMGAGTAGVKGAVIDAQVYSFAEGECETVRDLFLAVAKRGGSVFSSVMAGTAEAPMSLMFFGIN